MHHPTCMQPPTCMHPPNCIYSVHSLARTSSIAQVALCALYTFNALLAYDASLLLICKGGREACSWKSVGSTALSLASYLPRMVLHLMGIEVKHGVELVAELAGNARQKVCTLTMHPVPYTW